MPIREININLTKKQSEAYRVLFSEECDELLYGGAKGGAKSVFLGVAALAYAELVAKICKINKKNKPKFPYLIGFLGRQRAVDFNDTTLETFKKIIPSETYEIKEQAKEIIFFGSLKYNYGGLDNTDDIKKFNSAEFGLVAIDQAEELTRNSLSMLRGTLHRTKINGIPIPYKCLWTANPAECALKEDFFKNPLPGRKFIRALPSDNEFIDSAKYIQQLREAWKQQPEMVRAYVEGDWDAVQGASGFLLTHVDCENAQRVRRNTHGVTRTLLTIDPAWLSEEGDEIVKYIIRNNAIIDSRYDVNQSTKMQGADSVVLANAYKCSSVLIDTIGVGAGVYDECVALSPKSKIIGINSSQSAGLLESMETMADNQKFKYYNLRAEMWWESAEAIKSGAFVLPNDEKLIDQLCGVKYEIKNGKIKIEDKKEIKKRIGESPNRADCAVMGIWARNKIKSDMEVWRAESTNSSAYIDWGENVGRRGY